MELGYRVFLLRTKNSDKNINTLIRRRTKLRFLDLLVEVSDYTVSRLWECSSEVEQYCVGSSPTIPTNFNNGRLFGRLVKSIITQ